MQRQGAEVTSKAKSVKALGSPRLKLLRVLLLSHSLSRVVGCACTKCALSIENMQQQQSNDNNKNKNNSKNICEIVPIWEMLWEICACIDEKQVYGANERRK